MPLVGVWIKGARSVTDPIVYVSCMRYRFGSGIPDRADQQPSDPGGGGEGGAAPFLILMFPNGKV